MSPKFTTKPSFFLYQSQSIDISSKYTHARKNKSPINVLSICIFCIYILCMYTSQKNCGIDKFVPYITQLWKMIIQRQIIGRRRFFFQMKDRSVILTWFWAILYPIHSYNTWSLNPMACFWFKNCKIWRSERSCWIRKQADIQTVAAYQRGFVVIKYCENDESRDCYL